MATTQDISDANIAAAGVCEDQSTERIFDYVLDHCRHGDINAYLEDQIGPEFGDYRDRWRQAHNLEIETDFPMHISIESQLKCNYRCTMCTYSDPEAIAKQHYDDVLSEELYDQIIEEAGEHGCPSINLNVLNEPLLDKETPRRIKKAKDAGFLDIRMNTNASLLTETMAEAIIDAGLTRLYVGLDGATAETYEKVRIGGNFEKVVRNVERFLEIRNAKGLKLPILRVSFVRMNINEHEIPAFMEFWQEKADMVTIQEYQPPTPEDAFIGQHAASKRVPDDYTCPQPFERVTIKGNGNLTPCCAQYSYKLTIGNVKENGIHSLWNSPKLKNLRRHMKEGTWDQLPVCKSCLESSYLFSK